MKLSRSGQTTLDKAKIKWNFAPSDFALVIELLILAVLTIPASSQIGYVRGRNPQHKVGCPGAPQFRIRQDQVCNMKVDCPRASEEMGCPCFRLIHPSKICDQVYDCPDLEDEVGCGGCSPSQFACDSKIFNSPCIPISNRCDGIKHCPDGVDEIGCSLLSPTQHPPEVIVPKYSSGYVMHNFRDRWYPLCSSSEKEINTTNVIEQVISPICRITVGNSDTKAITFASHVIESPAYKGEYAIFNGTLFTVVNRCASSKLIFVNCPQPQCGRKGPGTIKQATANITKHRAVYFFSRRNRSTNIVGGIRSLGETRIVGGNVSTQGLWPWMVSITREGVFICGASILTGRWIVSAAHCFRFFNLYHYEATLGVLRRSSFSPLTQTRIVSRVFLHPNYDSSSSDNDIALLTVQDAFHLNQWTAPICLPSLNFHPILGTKCIVSGWGDTTEGGSPSDELLQVAVPITRCPELDRINPDSVICAGYPEGKKDSCKGDSGGPLICSNPKDPEKWILAGIVSFGFGCARPNTPGVYTRVTHHLDWIRNTIGNKNAPSVVPVPNCRGISCRLSVGRCLQNNSICNKNVECLDAIDELNC